MAANARDDPLRVGRGLQAEQRLTESLQRLSINEAARTPLPPSSPHSYSPRPSPASRPQPSPLRRCSSSMSVDRRSSSPALVRKTSVSSLRNDSISMSPRMVSRRSSANLFLNSPLAPAMEEPTPLTANTIANDHFAKELLYHQTPEKCYNTVIILHDSCYGHRYSRPKTTKNTLSLIVERPERIQAGTMGVSAAYVRLGERYAGQEFAPHPDLEPSKDIPFRILKTSRTMKLDSEPVTAVHGKKWMRELRTMCDNSGQKLASTGKELERVEEQGSRGVQNPKPKFHNGDLFLCPESINAFEGSLGGVCAGVDAVFDGSKHGKGPTQAFVCIRPPGHHCSADWPSGFCWLNNVHVGIQYAIQTHGLTHAAIIDFDLHHGDGSQAIAWGHNENIANMPRNTPNWKKTAIGYFSIHDINSYPCEYGDAEKVQNASLCIDNAHSQAIWNVHLHSWKTIEDFWRLYESRYTILLEKARSFLQHQTQRLKNGTNQPPPKAAIFISAGFDASEHESAGMQRHQVNVPTEFYARFTKDIVALAQEDGNSVDGRIVSVLEGGYSDKALISGIMGHIGGFCHGSVLSTKHDTAQTSRLGFEMSGLNGIDTSTPIPDALVSKKMSYEASWWHVSHLDSLEHLLNPVPLSAQNAVKKTRTGAYSSPTHASSMKVVDLAKVHRSTSWSSKMSSASFSRAPTPPPPEVDWITAAGELCKLLIPTDRQTKSCTADQLSEPKIKKEKIMPATVPANSLGGRQLRTRRAKATYAEPESEEDSKPTRIVSRSDRRKTIADVPLGSGKIEPSRPRECSRRLSVVSTISTASAATTATMSQPKGQLPSGGLEVKKTRVLSTTTARPSTMVPPVPRVPSGATAQKRIKQPESRALQSAAKLAHNAEVDSLTSGIKKITIKVPSEEEVLTRQQKKRGETSKIGASKITATSKKAPISKPNNLKTDTSGGTGKKLLSRDMKSKIPPKQASIGAPVQSIPANAPPTQQSLLTNGFPKSEQVSADSPVKQAESVSPGLDLAPRTLETMPGSEVPPEGGNTPNLSSPFANGLENVQTYPPRQKPSFEFITQERVYAMQNHQQASNTYPTIDWQPPNIDITSTPKSRSSGLVPAKPNTPIHAKSTDTSTNTELSRDSPPLGEIRPVDEKKER